MSIPSRAARAAMLLQLASETHDRLAVESIRLAAELNGLSETPVAYGSGATTLAQALAAMLYTRRLA